MGKFAKLYEDDELGQILVKSDMDHNGNPEIRFYCIPDGLGVCSVALTHDDTDEGWKAMEKAFESIDKKDAIKVVKNITNSF